MSHLAAVGRFPCARQIMNVIDQFLDLFFIQGFVEERRHIFDLCPQILSKKNKQGIILNQNQFLLNQSPFSCHRRKE